MGIPKCHDRLKTLVLQGMLLALAAAIFLVFLSPAIDHHFAERQHDHSHLYLTARAASDGHPSLHPFEESHSHTKLAREDTARNGILYQTSNDGLGETGTSSIVDVFDDGLGYPLHLRDSLSHAVAADEGEYLEAYVAIPKRPPRT